MGMWQASSDVLNEDVQLTTFPVAGCWLDFFFLITQAVWK